jgi:hypothetical protein
MLWATKKSRFNSCLGQEIFLFSAVFRIDLQATQTPVQKVLGVLFLGIRWLRREADHSPLSSAKVKNVQSCTSTVLHIYMALCLTK